MATERAPSAAGVLCVRRRSVATILGGALVVFAWAGGVQADATFFETRIRPVLASQCYSCHGADRADGALRLDMLPVPDPDGVVTVLQQRGADSHPAVDLPASAREHIRAWVAQGAPWPAPPKRYGKRGSMDEYIAAMQEEHWAFRPVRKLEPPGENGHPVDAFVRRRLAGVGLEPSPVASRRNLIRRAYHDLTGLPPGLEVIDAFEGDASPDAFAGVVDGLLASPHYGERWARHWLDVARYSDTKGSSFRQDRLFPFSYTYRDYVIAAFNDDLPYNTFIRHQLAADQMDLGDDKGPLAALGFLTLGKSFGANIHDKIDDRIDVVTRGLQGLTVNCARCHDHKFDPIPTADYYSLYGMFRSTQEPEELPLIEAPDTSSPAYQEYLDGLAKVEGSRDALLDRLHVELLRHARDQIGDYLNAVVTCWGDDQVDELGALAEEYGLREPLLKRWRDYLKACASEGSPVFDVWLACVALPPEDFATEAEALIAAKVADRSPDAVANRAVLAVFRDAPPENMDDVNSTYAELFRAVETDWQSLLAARLQRRARNDDLTLPSGLPDDEREGIRQMLYGVETPVNVPFDDVQRMSPREDRVRVYQRNQAVEAFKNSHPGRPNRAMALEDSSQLFDPYVFVRGDATNKGEDVPRRYLAVLARDGRDEFTDGSGRLKLANLIASTDNPLTARVFVNRVWAQLFDKPIVGTPSDFGTQGSPPTHPVLLDYLAGYFMENGWSTKRLIRHIMLSETYQQSSNWRADGEDADPSNELLWRQNRRRLDFETMRDNLLAAADNLDLTLGGFPTNITEPPFSNRRTVYAEVDRHALPSMFRIFDFATPNEHTPMRFETTVPQQALYMMNSAFVSEQARKVIARRDVAEVDSPKERVRAIYYAALRREPTEKELALGVLFVKGQEVASRRAPEQRDTTWRYGYGVVDEEAGRVRDFTEFAHWTGEAFQESEEMPGNEFGWAMLNRLGGHPGPPGVAVVRRWTSKADTLVSCVGELFHHSSGGDGIRAYIISSRAGILWQGDVQDGAIATVFDDSEIRVGDTVDLVVSCLDNDEEDAFRWHPRIYLSGENATQFETQDWITRFDFQGPPPAPPEPLKPWAQYAQVLLMSNEFMFVD